MHHHKESSSRSLCLIFLFLLVLTVVSSSSGTVHLSWKCFFSPPLFDPEGAFHSWFSSHLLFLLSTYYCSVHLTTTKNYCIHQWILLLFTHLASWRIQASFLLLAKFIPHDLSSLFLYSPSTRTGRNLSFKSLVRLKRSYDTRDQTIDVVVSDSCVLCLSWLDTESLISSSRRELFHSQDNEGFSFSFPLPDLK